ncbi:tyrosine-type recombinase/integrase [Kribbella rubisoli]|uniref:tyrosine-type recombinase/integrase n=1 Tax=Kribbella rubisoli TaxID=3075929 RepID=UPI003BAF4181
MKFGTYAAQWLESHNVELTTRARDRSLLKNHVVAHWANAPLSAIDHSSAQKWVTSLSRQLSPSTVGECHRLFSAVLKAASRDRLIAVNPAKDVRLPKKRQTAGDRQTISREEFTERLLPAVPERHRSIVALAGGTGLRWGECVGLRWESVDVAAGTIRVERVAVEVNGHVSPKPYPKSRAASTSGAPPVDGGASPGGVPRAVRDRPGGRGVHQGGRHAAATDPVPGTDLATLARPGRTARVGRPGKATSSGGAGRPRPETRPSCSRRRRRQSRRCHATLRAACGSTISGTRTRRG